MRLQIKLAQLFAAFSLLIISASVFADQSVQIAAAASFTDVFTNKIIPAFSKKTGITVLATYGATGLLSKQMENGAPYEVFVSADDTTPPKLAQENLIRMDSVHVFTVGRLVLFSQTYPVDVDGLNSPVMDAKGSPDVSIANPKTAPYGAAAIEALTNAKLLDKVQPLLVQAENVNQALQFTLTGNTDMAFTAYSLVIGREGHTYFVPQKFYTRLDESLGLSQNASDAAKQFEEYLLSKDGQKLLADAGYLKPPK